MIYENLVNRLRKAAGPAIDFPDTLYDEAADAIEELSKRVPPVPHGRLIDADALEKEHIKRAYENFRSYQFHVSATAWINEAPTIIPAEEETT